MIADKTHSWNKKQNNMNYTLDCSGLGIRERNIGRTTGWYENSKSNQNDWDQPILEDWLHKLNESITAIDGKSSLSHIVWRQSY
jgi:hypothetical protein